MPQELRRIFDEDAERYARARPGYPAELFTDLAELTEIGPGDGKPRRGRVLEIGPGTGQATAELVRLAADVTAVELGPDLAAALGQQLAPALAGGSFGIEVGAFEEWPLPSEPFDVVACFTAWHWLDPKVRSAKVAAALSPGGSLATVTTFHVRGGTVPFFAEAQDCYMRWDPATEPGIQLEEADSIPPARDEADTSVAFEPAIRRRYRQDLTYSTAAYLDLLNTYSGHRALPADRRAGLLGCLADLIDHRYGGTVTKSYLYELRVARTPSDPTSARQSASPDSA